MYVVDTDRAWEAMDPGDLNEVVSPRDVGEWPTFKAAIQESRTAATRDDFLVVDMVDKAWTWSQSHYFDNLQDRDFDEYLMDVVKAGDSLAGDYGQNWGVINKMYEAIAGPMQRFPGHVIACAPAIAVREPNRQGKGGDSNELRQLYGTWGYRPEGQKGLSHLFHTILFAQESPKGYTLNTVKERNPADIGEDHPLFRKKLRGQVVKQFTLDYLIQVAHWRP